MIRILLLVQQVKYYFNIIEIQSLFIEQLEAINNLETFKGDMCGGRRDIVYELLLTSHYRIVLIKQYLFKYVSLVVQKVSYYYCILL